ncbi:nuclear transport factor 2 family protein [Nocardia niigatensis]|uniref:nuclear transport factor 2 family protein n=1 Tax=Nocardia niigatensis TaxID=209249 RepID=UPI000592E832|nr:nuclear transport factor 2 family protein [Nocardia niigatensis]
MTTPHPTDTGFAAAYSQAWTTDPESLLQFFALDGTYTDVAMDTTYEGREAIGKFHRYMLEFAPDSAIVFGDTYAAVGRLYSEWVWSGTFSGPLRLRSGKLIDAAGTRFSVPGIAACTYNRDGLLTTHRDFWDLGTVLDQTSVPIG